MQRQHWDVIFLAEKNRLNSRKSLFLCQPRTVKELLIGKQRNDEFHRSCFLPMLYLKLQVLHFHFLIIMKVSARLTTSHNDLATKYSQVRNNTITNTDTSALYILKRKQRRIYLQACVFKQCGCIILSTLSWIMKIYSNCVHIAAIL